MGEVGNSYDNAYAERVNGIPKQEYALSLPFAQVSIMESSTALAVILSPVLAALNVLALPLMLRVFGSRKTG